MENEGVRSDEQWWETESGGVTQSIQGLSKANLGIGFGGGGGSPHNCLSPLVDKSVTPIMLGTLETRQPPLLSLSLSLFLSHQLSQHSRNTSVISSNLVGYFPPFVSHHILFYFPFSSPLLIRPNPIALSP